MPPVRMSFNSSCRTYARELSQNVLPKAIAKAISFKGRKVKSSSVMVHPQEFNEYLMAKNMPGILIEMDIHKFKQRRGREDKMAAEIGKAVKKYLKKKSRQPRVVITINLVRMGVAVV